MLFILFGLFSYVAAAPAPGTTVVESDGNDVIINQNVVVNQNVVSTVTVAGCAATAQETAFGIDGPPRESTAPGITLATSSTTAAPTYAPTVLTPGPHPELNLSDQGHLIPGPAGQMCYNHANDNGENNTVAIVDIPQMTHPVINLLHTNYVLSLFCHGDTVQITFNDPQAYATAAANWTGHDPFILITFSATCGPQFDVGEFDYILVKGIVQAQAQALTLILQIPPISFKDAVNPTTNITITIGGYSPSGNGSFSTGNNTSPGLTPTNGTNSNPGNNAGGACLAAAFDQRLDESLGAFISAAEDEGRDQLYAGDSENDISEEDTDFSGEDDFPDLGDLEIQKRSVSQHQKRWGFGIIGSAFKKVGNAISSAASTVATGVTKVADVTVNAVKQAANQVVDTLNDWTSINKKYDTDLSMSKYTGDGSVAGVETPWGVQGAQLYNSTYIQAYCVGCGANGKVHIAAAIVFTIKDGLKEGSLAANGTLHGVFQLGIVAAAKYERDIGPVVFAEAPLGGIKLLGIITIGPTLSIGAGGKITAEATGQLLAGIILDWPSVVAKIDVADLGSTSACGFTPNITPVFNASGELSISADAHLNVALGFTVDLLNSRWRKQAALVDQPGVVVKAALSAEASLDANNNPTYQIGNDNCSGIGITATPYNKVVASLSGFEDKEVPGTSWTAKDPLSACIPLFGSRHVTRGLIDSSLGVSSRTSSSDFFGSAWEASTIDIKRRATPIDVKSTRKRPGGSPTSIESKVTKQRSVAALEAQDKGSSFSHFNNVKRQSNGTSMPVSNITASTAAVAPPANATEDDGDVTPDGDYSGDELAYTTVTSLDYEFGLHWHENGNVYAIPSDETTAVADNADPTANSVNPNDITSLFSAYEGYIMGDANGKLLHGYANELAAHNVSRLRLHDPTSMPKTSVLLTLTSTPDPDGGDDFIVATDTDGNGYATVVCVYEACYPKVFVVADVESGPAALQNMPELTGPGVRLCGPMLFDDTDALNSRALESGGQ